MDDLAICAIMRNEARYLHEWLSYHYAVGVRRFVLYDNGSSDDSRAVVQAWARRDLVSVVDWPQRGAQLQAYADMVMRFRLIAEWCAFIDCDEFLVPQSCVALTDVLRAVGREANGLYVHWWMFGSSGHVARQPGLVTETFRWRAPDGFGSHFYGKSIVRLGALTHVGLHVFRCQGRMVNDAGWEIDQHSPGGQQQQSHRLLALNHYFTKSREEWRERRAQGKADKTEGDPEFRRTQAEFAQHDINAVQDGRAALFMQAARAMFYQAPATAQPAALPSPAVLLSVHGTLLCWDRDAARVVHRAPEQVGSRHALLQVTFAEAAPLHCDLSHALDGGTSFAVGFAGLGPLLTLRGDAGFVCAVGGTDAVHAQVAEAREWEQFLPLAPAGAARMAALSPEPVRALPGFQLLIESDRYDLRWAVPQARLEATEPHAAPIQPVPVLADAALALYDLADEPQPPALGDTLPIGPALSQLCAARRVQQIAVLAPAARLTRVEPFCARPVGSPQAPFAALFVQPEYRAYAVAELACCCLLPACVLSPDGLVVFEGRLLRDSAGSLEPWRPEAWAAEGLAAQASTLRLKRAPVLPAPRPGPHFCGFVGAWRNYAHWITECLPRLFAYRRLRTEHAGLRLLLPRLDPDSAQAQTLHLLGIGPEDVHTLGDGEVFAGTLWVMPGIDVWAVPPFCREAAAALADAAEAQEAETPPGFGPRIYIRRGTDTRRMVDLPGLQGLLDRYGFRVVTMQELSVAAQIRTMQQARWIIGEGGAALANIMFCEPAARVLELFNEAWAHPAHWTLASVCGLDYGFLEGRHVASELAPKPAHNADYLVTPEALEPALRMLLAPRLAR